MDTNYVVPSQTPTGHPVGDYSVVVDSRNEVNETNETNNEKGTNLAFSLPDIKVYSAWVTEWGFGIDPISEIYVGQNVAPVVTILLTNSFQPFTISAAVDGVTICTYRWTSITGAVTAYSSPIHICNWTVTQSQLNTRTFTMTVDSGNELNETNETNNQMSVTLPMVSRCGNGICESARGENSANCPTDCPPTSCTPRNYCSGNKVASQKADCSVSYIDCGVSPPNCCKMGKCIKSFSECGLTVDTAAPVAAQVQGPELTNALAIISMVVLVGIVLYAFIRIETDL